MSKQEQNRTSITEKRKSSGEEVAFRDLSEKGSSALSGEQQQKEYFGIHPGRSERQGV